VQWLYPNDYRLNRRILLRMASRGYSGSNLVISPWQNEGLRSGTQAEKLVEVADVGQVGAAGVEAGTYLSDAPHAVWVAGRGCEAVCLGKVAQACSG
jgi:hypothetical protein